MDTAQLAEVVPEVVLTGAWTVVFLLTVRSYWWFRHNASTKRETELVIATKEMERAYFLFTLAFLPTLILWLPLIGLLPPKDTFYMPVVLAWLVLLLFGSLQFYLGLTPETAILKALASSGPTETRGEPATSSGAFRDESSRNV